MKALSAAAKIGGPEPVVPGRFHLKEEARKARGRLLPTTLTFLGMSAAVVVAGVYAGPVHWVLASAAMGVVAFTFLEYCVHRFILHRRFPDGRGIRHILHKAFDHLHVQHHARPWDSNHNGGTLNMTLAPLTAIFVLAFLTTPLATGPVFWAAIVASYVVEEWIHHAIHYCSFTHPAFLAMRKHHFVHHAAPGTEANFGLSSPLWDGLLGTSFKASRPTPQE